MDLKKRLTNAINAFMEDDEEKLPLGSGDIEETEGSAVDECIEKGNDFETFVANKFSKKYFSIVEWTTDMMRKHDRYVESDSKPDLTMRYIPTDEKFCIECKFRSDLYQGALHWSNYNQLKRYQKHSKEEDIPFFVVIGLGGIPSDPERVFCIPIEEAKYPKLYPSVFENFEKDPESFFFWKNGILS
jgi:hypothetical protein